MSFKKKILKKSESLTEYLERKSRCSLLPLGHTSLLGPDAQVNDFLAEANPHLTLWPVDPYLRALARTAAAQMHSGFTELRDTYQTSFVGKYTGAVPITDTARKVVERMLALWADSGLKTAARLRELEQEDGGFLFGGFSIADAFFWPVLWVCIAVLVLPDCLNRMRGTILTWA